jgi:SH3 domain-containing protein
MVQPALKAFQMSDVPRTKRLAERIEAEVAAGEPEHTVSSMAERFAPDGLRAAKPGPAFERPRAPLGDAALAGYGSQRRGLPLPGRGVVVVLTAVALAPAAILAGLLWLGAIRGTDGALDFGARFTSGSQQATVAAAPVLRAEPAVPEVALTAPEEIIAKAGEDVAFAIAIDTANALPERSVIAIREVPEGAAFSEGRPYGDSEWSLRPDEIAGLTLRLPQDQGGASDLRVELVAADGAVLARSATHLEIAPPPTPGLVVRSEEADRVDALMDHGHKMMAVGYFAGARAYFGRAVEAGSGEAALALGATYDPEIIAGIGAHGIRPDPAMAETWYDRAATLGIADRGAKLADLKREWTPGGAPAAETAAAEPEEAAPAPVEPPKPHDEDRPGPLGRLVAAASELTSSEEWMETVSPVNMRADPSSTADTRKIVQKGLKVRVLDRKGNWVQVTNPATKEEGWIYARYLEPAD